MKHQRNPNKRDFSPKRNAAVAADERRKDVTDFELNSQMQNNIFYFQYQKGESV